jgi:hypothetical protein
VGTTDTVRGWGFGRHEQVTLALDGAALGTARSVITAADGTFTATFRVPSSLVHGANTVSAMGNQTRRSAVATLMGRTPVAAQFYFAGGMNTAREHSFVQVLNTNRQSVRMWLTFYSSMGATSTTAVDVGPTSQNVIPVARITRVSGTFGLYIKANRSIAAQLHITRAGEDDDTLLGAAGLGQTWYLAEGYTGQSFQERVSILNPAGKTAARVWLRLLPSGGRPGKTVPVTVPAHSNYVADINRLLPHQALSIIATASRPVLVERTLTFSSKGYGMTTRTGINAAAVSWILADGSTVNHFQTYLTILNLNNKATRVTAGFFGRSGRMVGHRTLVVAAQSRATITLNSVVHGSDIASVVTSDLPVVVERPEYFGPPNTARIAGSDVFGRNGADVQWSFASGSTVGTTELLLLYNPSSQTAVVDVVFYGSNGRTVTRHVSVPPTARYTLNVNQLGPSVAPLHGAVLRSANGVGFVAEQTLFAPNHTMLGSTEGVAQ